MREGIFQRLFGVIVADSKDRNLRSEDDLAWREAEAALKARLGDDYVAPGPGEDDEMRTLAGGDVTFNFNGEKKSGASTLGKIAAIGAAAAAGSGVTAGVINYITPDQPPITVEADATEVDIRGRGKPVGEQ